jgi:hypothetical protein
MTIEELYQERLKGDSHHDMREHLHTLRAYAEKVQGVVVEFGLRTGNSTVAFLAAGAHVLSYDINSPQFVCPVDAKHRWVFRQNDTTQLVAIPSCDILFLDSKHTEDQVRAELRLHTFCRRYIILHDTIEWGVKGECEQPGILRALLPFLADHNRTWRIAAHFNNCCGLTILERIGG